MPDDKFWGQYGPGVRRLRGSESPKGKPPQFEPLYLKVMAVYEAPVLVLNPAWFAWCFDACWRD